MYEGEDGDSDGAEGAKESAEHPLGVWWGTLRLPEEGLLSVGCLGEQTGCRCLV